MRVANIIEEGKLGGPQVRICSVAAALRDQVETIVVMPVENSQAFQQRCIELGVTYQTQPITRITKEWKVAVRYVLFSLFEVFRLAWVLKKGKYDLVHVSGGAWQYKGVLAAKIAGIKHLWHLNDTSMPRFIRYIFYIISPLADGFIFASERSRLYYGEIVSKAQSVFVLPAPVDCHAFDPNIEYICEKDYVNRWDGMIVIGTIANISPVKGLDVLIRSAAKLKELDIDVNFVVIGAVYPSQQHYFDGLKKLIRDLGVDNVEFIGDVSDVRPFMKRFDVYLCSSNSESSPMAVWEAMSMAKPIVSTNVGDVSLYIKDGENGFIVDVGESVVLSNRLARLIDDKSMRLEFGKKAREVAVRDLDISRCTERHLEAYRDILLQ